MFHFFIMAEISKGSRWNEEKEVIVIDILEILTDEHPECYFAPTSIARIATRERGITINSQAAHRYLEKLVKEDDIEGVEVWGSNLSTWGYRAKR